jgi:hypothetical protein
MTDALSPSGLHVGERLYLPCTPTCRRKISSWGWRYPFFCAFAINVVALFARLRLVVMDEHAQLLADRELEPNLAGELLVSQAYNVILEPSAGQVMRYSTSSRCFRCRGSCSSNRSVTEFLAVHCCRDPGECGVIHPE